MKSKEELYEELQLLKESIPRKHWFYFSFDAIDNFIYHLNDFSSERTSERMAKNIEEYLLVVQQKRESNTDLKQISKELEKYLWPIAEEYKYGQGFKAKLYYPVFIFFTIVSFILIKYFASVKVALFIVIPLSLVIIIRNVLKMIGKKVY